MHVRFEHMSHDRSASSSSLRDVWIVCITEYDRIILLDSGTALLSRICYGVCAKENIGKYFHGHCPQIARCSMGI